MCGQGRLEAYIAAGEKEIPAIIKMVSAEDAHIMSLVENIARRNNNALELLQSIKYLKIKAMMMRSLPKKQTSVEIIFVGSSVYWNRARNILSERWKRGESLCIMRSR